MTTASSRTIDAQFLAPPAAQPEKTPPRTSDCGEVAMDRLRHPFTVAADAKRRRAA